MPLDHFFTFLFMLDSPNLVLVRSLLAYEIPDALEVLDSVETWSSVSKGIKAFWCVFCCRIVLFQNVSFVCWLIAQQNQDIWSCWSWMFSFLATYLFLHVEYGKASLVNKVGERCKNKNLTASL
jgi:hypothetical protein